MERELTIERADAGEVAKLFRSALNLVSGQPCHKCGGRMLRLFAAWDSSVHVGIKCLHCTGAYVLVSSGEEFRLQCVAVPHYRKSAGGFNLDTLVRRFSRRRDIIRRSQDPAAAAGACRDLSEEFLDYIATAPKAFGLSRYSLTRAEGIKIEPHGTAPSADRVYHYVANLDGVYYDWSARQFRPSAPVPLIYKTRGAIVADWSAIADVAYETRRPGTYVKAFIAEEDPGDEDVLKAVWSLTHNHAPAPPSRKSTRVI